MDIISTVSGHQILIDHYNDNYIMYVCMYVCTMLGKMKELAQRQKFALFGYQSREKGPQIKWDADKGVWHFWRQKVVAFKKYVLLYL